MEELKMKIRQDKKSKKRWVYKWPMRKSNVKWSVRELMVKRQQRLLRRWLRYAENLRPIEGEEMVYICEPEIGDILGEENDQRSLWDLIDCEEGSGEFPYGQMGKGTELGSSVDLKNCQEGREVEIPVFHEGNELRSVEDLKYCHEEIQGISHFQLGDDQRSLRDLKYCQEGSGSMSNCQVGRNEISRLSEGLMDSKKSSVQKGVLTKMGSVDLMVYQVSNESIPYCQVGRDEQMNLNQPGELTEMRMSEGLIVLEIDLDQQVQMTKDEDQNDILMIGGISIFLPFSLEEVENFIADVAISEEQSAVTVKQKLEQMVGTAQEDQENERSEE
jgi:hypothetical protein